MSKILVSGLINLEVTLRIDGFPIDYAPVRYPFHGVNSSISGVGYNVAKALTVLGNEVALLSLIGKDAAGMLARDALALDGIAGDGVRAQLAQTAQSVILYDGHGRRAINVDLKDVQDAVYPPEIFAESLKGCSLAALCNINFSRPMLLKARRAGVCVATDVHAIWDIDDDYNRDFMIAADILFMSHEHLPTSPEEWARRVQNQYGNQIIVIGMGGEGALLAVRRDNFIERIPAVYTRPVVNTIGAGDALFSAFLHGYNQTADPYQAIRKAMVFASHKIGAASAADGFLDAAGLDALAVKIGI